MNKKIRDAIYGLGLFSCSQPALRGEDDAGNSYAVEWPPRAANLSIGRVHINMSYALDVVAAQRIPQRIKTRTASLARATRRRRRCRGWSW